jgi:hypothetical protein
MPKLIAAVAVPLMLAGCATQYQAAGLTGGHSERAGPGKMELVSFSGNGYITADKVRDYAMYRAAEVSKAKNKRYFLVYDGVFSAAIDRPGERPRVGLVLNKPIASAFILPLDEFRPGAKETAVVLRELDEVVHPKPTPKP